MMAVTHLPLAQILYKGGIVKNLISVLLFVMILFSVGFSAGGAAPAKELNDRIWVFDVDTNYTATVDSLPDIDTLDGEDSVRIYTSKARSNGGFKEGYQYIIACAALSGDSAANTVLQVILESRDKYDSLITRSVVDTIAAAGGYVKLPINETIFGNQKMYRIYLKSLNANDETVIKTLLIGRRRPFGFDVRNKF